MWTGGSPLGRSGAALPPGRLADRLVAAGETGRQDTGGGRREAGQEAGGLHSNVTKRILDDILFLQRAL